MNYLERAKEILEEQNKNDVTYNVAARAIAPYVKEVLLQFAETEPEFAQAIVQKDGSFADCCNACVKNAHGHISDKEVYEAAAKYYFPGATVKFEMTINLVGEAEKPNLVIDFTDFC